MKIEKLIFESFKPIFVYKGIKVFDTKHAVQRRIERASDLSEKDFQILFKRIINKLFSDKSYFDMATDYLFYSVSYRQGLVIYYKDPIIKIITILPKEAYKPKPKTLGVLIEKYLQENEWIMENKEILTNVMELVDENDLSNVSEEYDYEKIELPEYDLELYFSRGKLHDINKEIIQIS